MALNDITYFGSSTTYDPYANNVDLKLIDNVKFQIPNTTNFVGKNTISVAIGLVPSQQSFTADTFVAEIIETDNTVLQILKTKVGVVGNNEYPQVNEIIWFDEVGMQGEFWLHEQWKNKILKISGKFEATSITAEAMNNINKNLAKEITERKDADNSLQAQINNSYCNIYPVGIIIEFANDNHPNNMFPGTFWNEYGVGRVTVGRDTNDPNFNSTGKTGGASTHTLTINEMPRHNHSTTVRKSGTSEGSSVAPNNRQGNSYDTDYSGGSQPHNNLQPYVVVRKWIRVK